MSECNCGGSSFEGCSDRISNINMPTGPKGDTGTNGTNGEDGKGYDASSTDLISILGTSDTEVTITIDVNKAYTPGARVRVSKTSAPTTDYFEGIVTAYNVLTGEMTIESIDLKEGSGNSSSWNVNVAGEPGEDGEQGEKGETGDTSSFITELKNDPILLNTLKSLLLPIGAVITWSGDASTYFNEDGTGKSSEGIDLTGWGLCDASLGNDGIGYYKTLATALGKIPIPDLRGRFIVGYDPNESEYDTIGNNAGVLSHTLDSDNIPLHDHSVGATTSSIDGTHYHTFPVGDADAGDPKLDVVANKNTTKGYYNNQVRTGTTASGGEGTPWTNDGAHGHTVTITETEFGKDLPDALDNRPPYYVLAYIIKIDAPTI